MKERPILFSSSMVQAILEGRKTQTRRTRGLEFINEQPGIWNIDQASPYLNEAGTHTYVDFYCGTDEAIFHDIKCPYGKPGDRLWVRERWAIHHEEWWTVFYATDDHNEIAKVSELKADGSVRWRPSIHMPRNASRMLLEITDIRVERLQDITNVDAVKEGIESYWSGGSAARLYKSYITQEFSTYIPRISFFSLWESINGPDSWDANPFVWAIEFKKI
ncbi:hypothetical protein I2I11_04030 [Pontibacter sp. 172403-2]|nr:hypothetical protein [Pontibacter sp. 172403-2]